jgi:hypothetical protein
VKAVERLLRRPFKVGHHNLFVNYGRGQPMGAYSSFPMLGLTQHLLVKLATHLQYGYLKRIVYAVVGDDLVIGDESVAMRYQQLCEELEIPLNASKTVIGTDTFEFCRRRVRGKIIQSVPSIKSYFIALTSGDPTPLLKIYKEYMIPIPRYRTLLKVFKRGILRDMLAFQEFEIPDRPTSIMFIPGAIRTHAERIIQYEESLTYEDKKVVTDDPFLRRLNYGNQILRVYQSNLKKLLKTGHNIWSAMTKIYANAFYLGYVRTFLQKRKLKKLNFSYYALIRQDLKNVRKIRTLCMKFKNQWCLIA